MCKNIPIYIAIVFIASFFIYTYLNDWNSEADKNCNNELHIFALISTAFQLGLLSYFLCCAWQNMCKSMQYIVITIIFLLGIATCCCAYIPNICMHNGSFYNFLIVDFVFLICLSFLLFCTRSNNNNASQNDKYQYNTF